MAMTNFTYLILNLFSKKSYLTLLLLFFLLHSFGQENHLFLKYLFTNDTLQIRLAPSSPESWRQLTLKGIQIKKYQVEGNFSDTIVSEKNIQLMQGLSCSDSLLSKASFEYDSSWRQIINTNKRAAFTFSYFSNLCKATQTNTKKAIQQTKFFFPLALKNCDLNWELAKACGLYFAFPLKKGKGKYIYELSFVDPSGKNKKMYFLPNVTGFSHLPSLKIDSVFQSRKTVYLRWEAKSACEYFSYYDLEQSTNNVNFIKINSAPIVYTYLDSTKDNLFYVPDTTVRFPGKYYYRISAHTFFHSPVTYSDTVSIYFFPKNNFIPQLDSLIPQMNGEIKGYGSISFGTGAVNPELYNFENNSNNNYNHITGHIFRKLDSIYDFENLDKRVTEKKQNILQDSILILKRRNYSDRWKLLRIPLHFNGNYYQFTDTAPYRVSEYCLVFKNNTFDSVFSNILRIRSRDHMPPAVPCFTFASVNKTGIVKLCWDKNTEEDLFGYRVFRANDTLEQAVEITKTILTTTQYTDTILLNNLTPEIYYCIRAVDSVNNNSDYSSWIRLTKPDTVPPVPAQIKMLSLVSSSIKVNYLNSSSRDLCISDLYFKDEANNENYICSVYPQTIFDSIYLTNFPNEKSYTFYFKCYDISLNSSCSPALTCYLPASLKIDTAALTCVNRSNSLTSDKQINSGIHLTWNISKKKWVYSFSLYKRKLPDDFFLLQTLPKDCFDFFDKEVYLSNQYDYFLKVTYENGQNSFHRLKEPVQY